MSDGDGLEREIMGLFETRSFLSVDDAISVLFPYLKPKTERYEMAWDRVNQAAMNLVCRGALDSLKDGDFWIPANDGLTLLDIN